MTFFALPFAPSSTISHSKPSSAIRTTIRRNSKRKLVTSSSSSIGSTAHSDASGCDEDNNGRIYKESLDLHANNPLSLSPEEIAQYKLAGLALNEELPAVPGWPHRNIPVSSNERAKSKKHTNQFKKEQAKRYSTQENSHNKSRPISKTHEILENNKEIVPRGHQLHLKHINILTTILHKCLLNHDISRAGRAWGLLIRVQISGQGMDLRASGYWGIGAELLIRSLQTSLSNPANNDSDGETNELSSEENTQHMNSSSQKSSHMRPDIVEGLRRATDYYERLIVQFPYKRQFSRNFSALNWWPVMISCEIYGIQLEHRNALQIIWQKNSKTRAEQPSDNCCSDEHSQEEGNMIEKDTIDRDRDQEAAKRAEKNRLKRLEHLWGAENELRLVALNAAENIAARLDERMTIPPYSESYDLLQLRGMLALYIGDLSIPSSSKSESRIDDFNLDLAEGISEDRKEYQRLSVWSERKIDYDNCLAKRAQEIEKARSIFAKLAEHHGGTDDIMDIESKYDTESEDEDEDGIILANDSENYDLGN